MARYGDPERQIIMERHLRHQATTLKDLGARFGLSGESVRQMEMALKRRRAPLTKARKSRAPGRCGQQQLLFASRSSTSA